MAKTVKEMNNQEFELFARGALMSFLTEHDLENIKVDDGCGRKAIIRRTGKGEFKLSVTSQDTL